jgi:aminoglycoside phosphotransferase (APT) family kinase protein
VDALDAAWPLSRTNAPTLLHGDFWPGNVLWPAGRIVVVVDWEDACTGDPLDDAGNARLEILWAFGREAMEQFTRAYRAVMAGVDLAHLPYWDLRAALRPAGKLSRWGLPAAKEEGMREAHHWFVKRALAALTSPGLP